MTQIIDNKALHIQTPNADAITNLIKKSAVVDYGRNVCQSLNIVYISWLAPQTRFSGKWRPLSRFWYIALNRVDQ